MSQLALSTPGFPEIVTLAVLALLIFGPDRLPGMARNAGRMIARFKSEASSTLDELKRAAEIDELRGVADELRSTGRELSTTGRDLRSTGSEVAQAATLTTGAGARDRNAADRSASSPEVPPPFDPDAT